MKLKEIDYKSFDYLLECEPYGTIYQSSLFYDEKYEEYNPIFLELINDDNICLGLTKLLVKEKKNFFSKAISYAPCGYIINFFDYNLLNIFHTLLIQYLNERRIKKLIIEPLVPIDSNGNNNDIIKAELNKLGYKKINDKYLYEIGINEYIEFKQDENIYIGTLKLKNEMELIKYLDEDERNYIDLYNKYDIADIYLAKMNISKTKEALISAINDEEAIIQNNDNNKYHLNQLSSLKNKLNAIDCNNPVLGIICISKFSKKANIIFEINRDTNNNFNIHEVLLNRIIKDLKNEKYKKIIDLNETKLFTRKEYLGEFIYKI